MSILAGFIVGLASLSTAWAADLPRATHEEVGLSAERLARLDAYMHRQVGDQQVAGIQILVARHD